MGGHILIVEDNPIDLKLASELLKAHGYQVEGAADAEEALRVMSYRMPDLVLTDIALPGMDGLSFTRKLKADERFRHVPVIVLTAFAMRGDEERAVAAGCQGYIVKPIDVHTFAAQIAELLRPGS
ncbi:MAG TPA: response regulator [Steroidobacteraceae bacterium]|jgi:CheY-like chemotaxis protein|nr:response regulator [Steroidobacteraceae bacterium]